MLLDARIYMYKYRCVIAWRRDFGINVMSFSLKPLESKAEFMTE